MQSWRFTWILVLPLLNLGCSGCAEPPAAEGEGDGEVEGEGEGEGDPSAPVVAVLAPTSGAQFSQGETLLFSCQADDLEDGALTGAAITWSTDVDGPIGIGNQVQTALVGAGARVVTCTATDSTSRTGSASVDITILGNQAPVVSVDSPEDGAYFLPSDSITFTGSALDPEDGLLTNLVWTDNSGALGNGAVVTTALPLGDHLIAVRATDADGAVGLDAITIHVVSNLPPRCTIQSPDPGDTFVEGDSVQFRSSCTDPDGVSIIPNADYLWSSSLQGQLTIGQNTQTALVLVGTHLITVCANDTVDATLEGCATVTVQVVANTLPTASIQDPNDGEVLGACAAVDLRCNVADANGNQNLSVRWLDNGVEIAAQRNILGYRPTDGAHVLTCEVTDSVGGQGTDSIHVTVEQVTATIVTPNDGQGFDPGQNILFTATACSARTGILTGAALSWSSSLDGALGTGNLLNRSDLQDGTHVITLAATDSQGGSGAAQIVVYVSLPPDVTITAPGNGATVDANSATAFTGTAVDPEDGALIPTWSDSALGDFATGNNANATLLVGKHELSLRATDSAGRTGSDTIEVYATPGGVPFSTLLNNRASTATVRDMIFDAASGFYWLATSAGLVRVDASLGSATTFTPDNSDLPNANLRAVALMADGTLMVGTDGDGVAVGCSATALTGCQVFSDGDLGGELNTDRIEAVAVLPDGRTLMAIDGGVLFSNWSDDTHHAFRDGDGGGDGIDDTARSIVVDGSGVAWIVTAQNDLLRMTPEPYGGVSSNGLNVFDRAAQEVKRVALAPSGDVWLATGNGLEVLDPVSLDTVARVRTQDGLPSNDVRDVAIDVVQVNGADHEIAWAATAAGLVRIDLEVPSVVTLDTSDGLPSNNLSQVIVGPSHQKLASWLSGGGTPGGTFTYSGL